MNTSQNTPVSEHTFIQFLFHNRRNRIILYLAAAAIVIQFTVFKYLYPFANYIHGDSFVYLEAAYKNSTINSYPIGYSKFLRLVSVFAKPDLVLVSIQYLMIQCSNLFLLFTIFYFYKAGRATQALLFFFMIVNPLLLHLANMVSSDGVFLALSMTWFALLLWIIYKPSNTIIGWHAVVILAAFAVRYNALIYPFVAGVAFGLSKQSLLKKLTGWGSGLLLISWFVGLSMYQYKKLTGYWQYSPFSGWLLANNAMYAYQEVDSANRVPVPSKFRAVDHVVTNFYDMYVPVPFDKDGAAYMWGQQFPLMQYCDSLFKSNTAAIQLKPWASMGPVYSSYGGYLIKNYPGYFLRYFAWPNTKRFIAPPLGYLGPYNTNQPTVQQLAVKWFGYSNNRVRTRTKDGQALILKDFPFLVCILYMILFLMLLSYVLLKGWQYSPSFNKIIILGGFFWITNAAFSIFASAVELRFQAFPVLLSGSFAWLLIDWMVQLVQHLKQQGEPANSVKIDILSK